MPTMSEIEAEIKVGFKDLLFSMKVLTGVIGIGFLSTGVVQTWLIQSQMRETQNLSSQVDTLNRGLQGMKITQTQSVERQTNKDDAIDREMARMRNQEKQ